MACFTQVLVECFVACNIAKKDITRKRASIHPHQAGDPEQHVAVHVFAMNINGVLTQWIIHNVLATIPIVSDFIKFEFILKVLNATELQKYKK